MTLSELPYGEIYVVTCKVHGKQYVGQTTAGVEKRWYQHLRGGGSRLLTRAFAKYGTESFEIRVVDLGSDQVDLDRKESHWIETLGTLVPKGYNLTSGGTGGHGGKRVPELVDRIRIANTGKKRSPETCANLSLGQKNRPPTAKQLEQRARFIGCCRGRRHTPETIEKMKQAHKGKQGKRHTPEAIEKIKQARARTLSKTPKAKS